MNCIDTICVSDQELVASLEYRSNPKHSENLVHQSNREFVANLGHTSILERLSEVRVYGVIGVSYASRSLGILLDPTI